jgi:hypothetical protein
MAARISAERSNYSVLSFTANDWRGYSEDMSHPWTCLEQVRRAAHTFQLTGFRDAMLQLIMTGIQLIMTG